MEKNSPALSRRLSGLDAAFLYLERKELPLNVAGVCVFDRPIPFKDFLADVESKLGLLPRYRQIVVAPPFNIGYPTWEDDAHFDIRRHVFRVRLKPPGGEAELEALAGRLFGQVMDRSKPLWDIHVVSGLEGGRGALIVRMHHALADGVAGASLVKILLDPTPERAAAVRKEPPARQEPPPAPSLSDAVGDVVYNTLDHLLSAEKGLLDFAQSLTTEQLRTGLEGLASLLPELAGAVERLPFNKRCSGDRKFCWSEVSFADAQAIRAVSGGTLNDVVLSVLTRAIARYVQLHGQTVTNRLVRIVIPVNLREDEGASMGNQISFLPVVLPLDEQDPIRMVRQTAIRMETMKRAKAAELLAMVANCLGAAPPSLQALIWGALPDLTLPLPLFNTICTNVPGSRDPLYSVGRRMISCYPHVPTGYDLGVNCAVLSYDGKLCIGLIADAHVVPDVRRLRDYFRICFEELCAAAGVKAPPQPAASARKPQRRPKTKVAAEPATEPAEMAMAAGVGAV